MTIPCKSRADFGTAWRRSVACLAKNTPTLWLGCVLLGLAGACMPAQAEPAGATVAAAADTMTSGDPFAPPLFATPMPMARSTVDLAAGQPQVRMLLWGSSRQLARVEDGDGGHWLQPGDDWADRSVLQVDGTGVLLAPGSSAHAERGATAAPGQRLPPPFSPHGSTAGITLPADPSLPLTTSRP